MHIFIARDLHMKYQQNSKPYKYHMGWRITRHLWLVTQLLILVLRPHPVLLYYTFVIVAVVYMVYSSVMVVSRRLSFVYCIMYLFTGCAGNFYWVTKVSDNCLGNITWWNFVVGTGSDHSLFIIFPAFFLGVQRKPLGYLCFMDKFISIWSKRNLLGMMTRTSSTCQNQVKACWLHQVQGCI